MEHAVETIFKEFLTALGIPFDSVTHSKLAGQVIFSIQTPASDVLMGGRGDTIHALDMLVKKIYEKRVPATPGVVETRFLIDVNDYQVNRIKELQAKALVMAERARSLQYDVELTPMSSYERLIVHTTLQDQPNIKTESLGEGRDRRVVIKYATQ